jgi:hypothetical protein
MVNLGTVVLGTATGPPPPVEDEADPETTELPAPVVRSTRASSVPESAVVTKPPTLGLAMFHPGEDDGKVGQGVDPIRGTFRGQRDAHGCG